mmetsp:Transcript_32270/g.57059  ORF Transcript_32270/g.57059 Transcript_32270/m.57059 type:complete len:211 (+) Transcript_32270:100-732(+)
MSEAKITIDSASSVATLELYPDITTEALEEVLEKLHGWRAAGQLGSVCIHCNGKKYPTASYSKLISNGAFFEGLRAIGVPIAASVTGYLEGPMWLAVMNADYRVGSNATVFCCPPYGKPVHYYAHLGQEPSKQLACAMGHWSALKALNVGVIMSSQPRPEDAKTEAFEFAKRVQRFPNLTMRRPLLGPPDSVIGKKTCYRRMNLDGPSVF